MKLEEARREYYAYTGKASEITRTLGLSGLAIVWLLSGGLSEGTKTLGLSPWLAWVGVLFIVALLLDLFQYIWGAAAWGGYARFKEKRFSEQNLPTDTIFKAPPMINWPTLVCFWTKLAALGLGYLMLAIEFATYLVLI